MHRKKRVGFISSSLLVRTGFSNNLRVLLPYLYKTNKYEIFHLNQGIGDDSNLKRYPWQNEGVFKNFDQNRFNSGDEGYRRYVSYGNAAVEDWIIKNKLDVIIHQEDIWSSEENTYLKSRWWNYLKDNFLQHSTADSLPILPSFKTWAENCSHVWFWTSFAEKALKKENPQKYSHVKTVHACVDTNSFKPISLAEKTRLRNEFNIPLNDKVFIHLGRNQLRKLYGFTISSFAEFKKQNPEKKAKLLLHCSWSEPGGWPLERMVQEHGLNKEDVLAPYFCRACGRWEVKPFSGEDQDCRYCGAQKAQITAGITSSISNEDLAKIYGMCDACVSPFTSGGFEFCNAESILCELPLLCSDYSAGEDFCEQDFVSTLDGSFTFEHNTAFKKFVPNKNTMVKFYKKICEMSNEDIKKIGKKGREWALKSFDVSVIGKKFEEWIDSRGEITWDYKYPPVEPKNPNAPIPNIQDNQTWVKTLYKEILKMDVGDEDSGLKSWVNNLSKGQKREQIESYFRNVAAEDNKKSVAPEKQPSINDILTKNGKKRVLLLMKESIGDIINVLALLPSIRSQYPENEYDIYFSTEPQYFELLESNQNINYVISYNPILENELYCTGQGEHAGFFDVYINVAVLTQKHLSYLTHNSLALKLNE
jgi:glycosyltransferase involved in cell wall biosynthesis